MYYAAVEGFGKAFKIVNLFADYGLNNVILKRADYSSCGIAGYNACRRRFAIAYGAGVRMYLNYNVFNAVHGAQRSFEGNAQRHRYHAEPYICYFHTRSPLNRMTDGIIARIYARFQRRCVKYCSIYFVER